MDANSTVSAQPQAVTPVREKGTTIWLWLVIVLNAILGLLSLVAMLDSILFLLAAICSFAVSVGAFMILQWKKVGVYLAFGGFLASIVVNLMVGGSLLDSLRGFIPIAILYYALQFPKNNKVWDHLK